MISEGIGKAGVKYHSGATISAARIARCASTAATVVITRFVVATSDGRRVIVSNMLVALRDTSSIVRRGRNPMIGPARDVVVALEQIASSA
jgi:hypothetical protein